MRSASGSIAAVLILSSPALASVRYVDSQATGANDGTSWANAHTELRDALAAAAPGDEIWVARGVYVPGPTAAESDSFFLASGVKLYGGFAGGETSLAQRDWLAHPTILSGDVGRDDAWGNPWYSGTINSANSAHVVTALGVDASAALDGFTIESGHTGPSGTPAGSTAMYGGGLYAIGSALRVENCTFRRNVAAFAAGGAVYALDSSLAIKGCAFHQNYVHLGSGAAVISAGTGAPAIEDCVFTENIAVTGSGGQEGQGAAVAIWWSSPPITILRCRFERNSARQFWPGGAGIEQARGGGISCFSDGLVVRDCTFLDNDANAGAGVFAWGSTEIVNCLFAENRVYNMSIGGQTVSGYASAIGTHPAAGDLVRIDDCTIVRNHVIAGEAAAVYGGGAAPTEVRNSILWANTSPAGTLRLANIKGSVTLSESCVENLFTPDPIEPPPAPSEVPGCIDSDPLFVDLPNLDPRLTAASPCVDSGSNDLVPGFATTDLDGNDRVAQGASSLTVDMGCYELGGQPPGPCASIVAHPLDTRVFAGRAATLQVLAMGAPLAYQWRKAGVPLAGGAAISGATTPVLRISPASTGDAGTYDVVVQSGCAPATSLPAVLTVDPTPLGQVFCSGDGNGPGCPCGNDKDLGEGCENSTGDGARLAGTGSPSVSANDAALSGTHLPSDRSAIFFMGASKVNAGLGNWFGDGLLCVHATKRFAVQNSGPNGSMTLIGPAGLAPLQIQPGSTLHFQVWYRDPTGPCGGTFNTSNAYSVSFAP